MVKRRSLSHGNQLLTGITGSFASKDWPELAFPQINRHSCRYGAAARVGRILTNEDIFTKAIEAIIYWIVCIPKGARL